MDTVRERINYLIKKKMVTAYKVSKDTGVSQSALSRIRSESSGQDELQLDTAKALASYFDVNINWLLAGEGEISSSKKQNSVTPDIDSENMDAYSVPLLPVSAIGGTLTGFAVQVKDSEHEKIISPIKDVDFALTVTGDSMAPEYPSGSRILIKRINEKIFIDWGRTYVLDTINGVVIKNLYPAKDENGKEIPNRVICRSVNPDFPDFEMDLNKEILYGIYRVLLCLSLK